MPCLNKINHTIQHGDTLYKLSKMYNTTVDQILIENPYLNPYNLQIGSVVSFCSDNFSSMPSMRAQEPVMPPPAPRPVAPPVAQPAPQPRGNPMNYESEIINDNLPRNQFVSNLTASNMQRNPQSMSSINSNMQRNPMVDLTNNSITGTSCTLPCKSQINLITDMNFAWERHVEWVRAFLISVADNLQDIDISKARALQTPIAIANVFRKYYGDEIANSLKDLLTEHVSIGGDIIVGSKNGSDVSELNAKWYRNADKLADYLSSINLYYNKEELRKMLYNHLDLESKMVSARLKKDYAGDVKAADNVVAEALDMSRYLAEGIIKQFPNMF